MVALTVLLLTPSLEKWARASPNGFIRKRSGWLPLIAGALAGAVAGAVAVAGALAGAVAGALAGALGGAAAGLIQRGRSALAYIGLFSLIFGILALTSAMLPIATLNDQRLGILLFLGLFPLVNGVFDFLSYGVTLGLWRLGLRKGGIMPWVTGALDIVAALILFTGLGRGLDPVHRRDEHAGRGRGLSASIAV